MMECAFLKDLMDIEGEADIGILFKTALNNFDVFLSLECH